MAHAFSSLDELGDGPGLPQGAPRRWGSPPSASTASSTRPAFRAISHYHDTQDELYFVHSGTAKVEVDGEERILGPGGLFHVESTTPRRIANAGDDELVLLVDRRQGRLRRARRPRR